MAWRKSQYQLDIEKKWNKKKRGGNYRDRERLDIWVPKSFKARIDLIADWEQRTRVDVATMTLSLGLEVYDKLLETLSGKIIQTDGLPAIADRAVLMEAIGRAKLVEMAANEVIKRNREWLIEREAERART
jgi:hypothetical protein